MKKETVYALLGGTARTAADHLGVSMQAVMQWPEELSRVRADRVIAARIRLEWADAKRTGRGQPEGENAHIVADALALPDGEDDGA